MAGAAAAQAAALAELHAPEVTYQPKAAPAGRRGAVIGSKPQLSAQGLLEHVQLNKEREDAQRAQARPALRPPSLPHCVPAAHVVCFV